MKLYEIIDAVAAYRLQFQASEENEVLTQMLSKVHKASKRHVQQLKQAITAYLELQHRLQVIYLVADDSGIDYHQSLIDRIEEEISFLESQTFSKKTIKNKIEKHQQQLQYLQLGASKARTEALIKKFKGKAEKTETTPGKKSLDMQELGEIEESEAYLIKSQALLREMVENYLIQTPLKINNILFCFQHVQQSIDSTVGLSKPETQFLKQYISSHNGIRFIEKQYARTAQPLIEKGIDPEYLKILTQDNFDLIFNTKINTLAKIFRQQKSVDKIYGSVIKALEEEACDRSKDAQVQAILYAAKTNERGIFYAREIIKEILADFQENKQQAATSAAKKTPKVLSWGPVSYEPVIAHSPAQDAGKEDVKPNTEAGPSRVDLLKARFETLQN